MKVRIVVPYVGTWIEICSCRGHSFLCFRRSLRGNVDRNSYYSVQPSLRAVVVPYVGTWIEIAIHLFQLVQQYVVPYVGTWIEIYPVYSLPLYVLVVPYVGTWIEIY